MNKVKKGDLVRVLSGSEHGSEGKVLLVYPAKGLALVEGVNLKHHFIKGRENEPGKIEKRPGLIPVSKISTVVGGKVGRVAIKVENNKKIRVHSKSGQRID